MNNSMKIHFASFSAGNEQYRLAAKRIKNEALNSKYFDEIHVCDESSTYPILKNHLQSNSEILKYKGFGYWSWKPHLILDIFEKASEGDVICYADSGCQISPIGFEKFKKNISICKKFKSLFFHMPNILEKNYNKYKLLKYFNSENDAALLQSFQIQAGYFYIEVCNENLLFIKKWAELSKLNNFSLIDDSESYGCDDSFIAHRHDQSILSILVKKAKLITHPHEDSFKAKEYYINSPIMLYPIHTLRTKHGKQRHALAFKYSNKKMIYSKNYYYKYTNKLFYFIQMIIMSIPFVRRIYN
jgi:hypothetical protein